MLDFAHLPKPQNGTVDYFPGFSSPASYPLVVWNKPKNCMFIRILCIGGGAGGGGGFSSATTNARGGGGGGASGGMVYVTYPAVFLPDRLYVSSGTGGKGGSGSGVNGSVGMLSYVCIAPDESAIYTVCKSNNTAPSGGTAGYASSFGTFGSAGGGALCWSAVDRRGAGAWPAWGRQL